MEQKFIQTSKIPCNQLPNPYFDLQNPNQYFIPSTTQLANQTSHAESGNCDRSIHKFSNKSIKLFPNKEKKKSPKNHQTANHCTNTNNPSSNRKNRRDELVRVCRVLNAFFSSLVLSRILLDVVVSLQKRFFFSLFSPKERKQDEAILKLQKVPDLSAIMKSGLRNGNTSGFCSSTFACVLCDARPYVILLSSRPKFLQSVITSMICLTSQRLFFRHVSHPTVLNP